jgi:MoaA/NifB/PqqE/SkfB family radical SAM enzyme
VQFALLTRSVICASEEMVKVLYIRGISMQTSFLRSIILSGGNKCFVRCPGCYNYFGKEDYDTDDLMYFLKYVRGQFNIDKITMAGGEPLIRQDMPYIIQSMNHMGFYINVDTVGLSFARDVVLLNGHVVPRTAPETIVPYVNMIGIPIDGSTDSMMQLFRQALRVQDILEVLSALDNVKANICINTVVHRDNIDDLGNIFSIISRYTSIKKWQLFQYMPVGPGGFKNRHKYVISDEAFALAEIQLRRSVGFSNVQMEFKSRTARKNKYLLVDGCGDVWFPRYNTESTWDEYDDSRERIVLGNISERNRYDRMLGMNKDAKEGLLK